MSGEDSSFLSRWSRRKLEVQREQAAAVKPVPPLELPPEPLSEPEAPAAEAAAAPVPAVELPSLDSLDGLRSDYSAFMGDKVSEDTKRSALKKLFGDPHFNQMDGLDTYIDDYTNFEPLPDAMRLMLNSAQDFLLDSEKAAIAQAKAALSPVAPVATTDPSHAVSESAVPNAASATIAAPTESPPTANVRATPAVRGDDYLSGHEH